MIAEDQGYMFEVGFNIGILTAFEKLKLGAQWVKFYRGDLQALKFRDILKELVQRAKAVSALDEQIIDQWSQLVLLRGFLAGFNFFDEYFQSTGWKTENTEVLYCQFCFVNSNSLWTFLRDENEHHNMIIEHFCEVVKNLNKDKILNNRLRYTKKGEFLKADSLILLRHKEEYRVIVVDTSIFSLKSAEDITNLELVEVIKRQLQKEINYLRSKSSFAKLRIDTGKDSNLDLGFSEGLKYHFTAFKYDDKESSKLIQAASYGYSFGEFLKEIDLITSDSNITVSALGNSDRSLSSLTVSKENISLLKTCYEIYKHDSSEKEIKTAREKVLTLIKNQAISSFNEGQQFIDKLFNLKPDILTTISHTECLKDFFNTVATIPEEVAKDLKLKPELDLRNAHAELINQALLDKSSYIFLTGNPGIGKTTAIANFLKQHLDEGFLFFYVSPRKQVNIDILEKFSLKERKEKNLCDDRLFYLNTNAYVIANNSSNYTVEYLNNLEPEDFTLGDVKFINAHQPQKSSNEEAGGLERQAEDLLLAKGNTSKGVIDSLCRGIHQLIKQEKSNHIIATACIQSLKQTHTGNTLEHFEKIFSSAYNSKTAQVIPKKMQAIATRIKHLFIMIDEITGDSSGVEFLNNLTKILSKYKLIESPHGFNTKIIVADASIVDKDVIIQHLGDNTPEGDKIFFRKSQGEGLPLSWQEFEFKGKKAIAINTNSYPAKTLTITYKAIVKCSKFTEETKFKEDELRHKVNEEILQDIANIEEKSSAQILVYIQNKERLNQLIETIKKQKPKFKPKEDYLEVHANITEYERRAIEEQKNKVKIIFMTSSGSRGLSFPLVKHILVDIPKFQIENNLMEVIQAIYRGRGDFTLDQQDKELIFYVAEKAVYYDQESQLSLQESLLNLLNLFLLLKAAIMTRIKGAGKIGRDSYLIIPIGGKAVTSVHHNFSSKMSNLLRELKQESRAKPWDMPLKDTHETLQHLLNQANFSLSKSDINKDILTYLKLQENLHTYFAKTLNQGFDGLLKLHNLEPAYLCGSLILVPIGNNTLQENYQINLAKILNLDPQISEKLKFIRDNAEQYHDNLRLAVKKALLLIANLQDQTRTQNVASYSNNQDGYYAFTLFTLLNNEVIKEYLTKENGDDLLKFREILELYLRSLYSVGNVLPIGDSYDEFPFIIFDSYILKEMRQKIFTDRYLLNSQEFNVVNLILSK